MQRKIVTHSAGESICIQGLKTDSVFHLLGGRVSLWNQKEKVLELEPIHILGLEGCYNRSLSYSYTVRAETDTRLIAYDASQIPEIFFQTPQLGRLTLESLVQQLESHRELVRKHSQAEDRAFFAGDIQTFGPGEFVIKEDEETTAIYRIISTSKGLEVVKNRKVLALIQEPGEFFGEMAAVSKTPRTASVRSVGETVLEVYPEEILPQVLEDYPDMAMRIITGLSERLTAANRLLTKSGTEESEDPQLTTHNLG